MEVEIVPRVHGETLNFRMPHVTGERAAVVLISREAMEEQFGTSKDVSMLGAFRANEAAILALALSLMDPAAHYTAESPLRISTKSV